VHFAFCLHGIISKLWRRLTLSVVQNTHKPLQITNYSSCTHNSIQI